MLLLVFKLIGCKTCGSAADAGGTVAAAAVAAMTAAATVTRPSAAARGPLGNAVRARWRICRGGIQGPTTWRPQHASCPAQRHAGPALVLEGRLEGGQTSRCSNALADNREGEGAGQSRWQLPGA